MKKEAIELLKAHADNKECCRVLPKLIRSYTDELNTNPQWSVSKKVEQRERIHKYKKRLAYTQERVDAVEQALSKLTDKERLVIEAWFIDKVDNPVVYLQPFLHVKKTQMYTYHDRAIDHFTRVLFGVPDEMLIFC